MKKSLALILGLCIFLSACTAGNPTETIGDPTLPPTSSHTTATTTPVETGGADETAEPSVPDSTQASESSEPTEATHPAATVPSNKEDTDTPKQTEPKETEPPVTTPPPTDPPETKPPETEPLETQPENTAPLETEPSETEPSNTTPTEEFKQQVAYYVAYYINQYRAASGVPSCTVLPVMTLVAEYRADQLTYNYSHSTADKRAALTSDTPNMTITINAVNKLITGTAKIVKETTNGGSKAGWHFTVKDAAGNKVGDYVTDASGEIMLSVVPGTYTVTETDGSYKYWVNDPEPTKTITVKANETATVTFKNQWRGQAQIIKTSTNGGSVTGWHFEVKDDSGNLVGNYVTDTTGIITLDLEPGTYSVSETDGKYDYWHNDPQSTKTVTVKAGGTAKVTFMNQWKGKAQIIKTATNGGSVAGWHFEVKDSAGNVIGNYVTDATGVITLDLDPGTFSVTETDGEYPYWHNDPQPTKTVTIKAGETAKVTFTNQWVGKAKIVKTTTNGGTVAGWEFTITNSNGNKVGTYVTDATGTIVVDLEPGSYTIVESDKNDPYWYCDTEPQTITVKAGETSEVTFHNQWIGKAKIIKRLDNPEAGTVEGWTFAISRVNDTQTEYIATVKTGADGTILYDLEPGQYQISEVLEENSLWQCVTGISQVITVKAGETSEVTFTNALRPGKISVQKVDIHGEPLSGAKFVLQWSEDGATWNPVFYSDSAVVVKGGCSNADVVDGALISPDSGLISWDNLYPTLQYRILELEAPEGYVLLSGPAYEGELPVDDLTVSLRVVNNHSFTLPETGSKSMVLMPLSVLLCLGLCASALVCLRKRRQ